MAFPISPAAIPSAPKRRWRGWWLKQLHSWHWISAALSLTGMLLFAATGFTLNHAASIGAAPVVIDRSAVLPRTLLATLAHPADKAAALPPPVAHAVAAAVGIDPRDHAGEWSPDEVYVALPRPGGDAWVSIDRGSGAIKAEVTDRGWISYLNDLHKGRNAGTAWFWFIDAFAGACVLFSVTGLLLLQFHARRRPMTWPLVGVGVALPLVIAIVAIH